MTKWIHLPPTWHNEKTASLLWYSYFTLKETKNAWQQMEAISASNMGPLAIKDITGKTGTNICVYIIKTLILFIYPSDIYPEVELVDHMVVLFLIFWGTISVFQSGLPIYTITNNALVFPFSIFSPTLFISCLFDHSQPNGVKWFWFAFLWCLVMLKKYSYTCFLCSVSIGVFGPFLN